MEIESMKTDKLLPTFTSYCEEVGTICITVVWHIAEDGTLTITYEEDSCLI